MSKLTDLQLKLAELLKALRITKDSAIAIALMLQDDNKIIEFAKWIKENTTATESQIVRVAVKIDKKWGFTKT